jgi:hypothetical protein
MISAPGHSGIVFPITVQSDLNFGQAYRLQQGDGIFIDHGAVTHDDYAKTIFGCQF